jgi:transposase InsO family protein
MRNNKDQYTKPGRKWVSDLIYLRTSEGWVYLTIVLDLFDRKVIGWAFSGDMKTEHTAISAVNMAFKNRQAQADLLFHSDRGVQYCAFGRLITNRIYRIVISSPLGIKIRSESPRVM